jgi:hypothetical protein
MKSVKFDKRFADEVIAEARKLNKNECIWMSAVGVRKHFPDYDVATQERLEDIYWTVAQGKAQAARAGVAF